MSRDFANLPSPRRPAPTSGKGQVYLPAAGVFGMWLFLISLSVLFSASIFGYVYIRFVRFAGHPWPPPGFPKLPATLWASTLVILLTSVTIQYGYSSIKRGHAAALFRGLVATFVLGLVFLALQTYNWWEIYSALAPDAPRGGSYLGLFYMLTGLHAAHVIGGLIPLIMVSISARRRSYSADYHPGPRYCTMYWHFLDLVWVVLFTVVYLI